MKKHKQLIEIAINPKKDYFKRLEAFDSLADCNDDSVYEKLTECFNDDVLVYGKKASSIIKENCKNQRILEMAVEYDEKVDKQEAETKKLIKENEFRKAKVKAEENERIEQRRQGSIEKEKIKMRQCMVCHSIEDSMSDLNYYRFTVKRLDARRQGFFNDNFKNDPDVIEVVENRLNGALQDYFVYRYITAKPRIIQLCDKCKGYHSVISEFWKLNIDQERYETSKIVDFSYLSLTEIENNRNLYLFPHYSRYFEGNSVGISSLNALKMYFEKPKEWKKEQKKKDKVETNEGCMILIAILLLLGTILFLLFLLV